MQTTLAYAMLALAILLAVAPVASADGGNDTPAVPPVGDWPHCPVWTVVIGDPPQVSVNPDCLLP